jgi:hypothetical protein
MLWIPMVSAVLAADAGRWTTTPMTFESLATAPVGGYYLVKFPEQPDFSGLEIVSDKTYGRRSGPEQVLITAANYRSLAGRQVVLVSRQSTALGSGDERSRDMDNFRRRALATPGRGFPSIETAQLVRLGTWQDLGLSDRPSGDLLLEWGVDSPEYTHLVFTLMSVASYLFVYVGIMVFTPWLSAGDDREAVARFRRIDSLWERLFGFVR